MALPEQFGHYEVRSELGRGGMAIVYKCWEEALHRFVAIKVLSPQLATDNDIKERFFREAKSMAAVSHPNVINVHFIGEENGLPFFAMEYIEGQSLSQILRDNRALDVEHAKNILHQACEGLQAAHESGLIHRDIKPGNILISNNGFLKLMDFGIAQSKTFDSNLTQTGEVIGTPGYLSPEICTGQIVDKRSDIYSLGIVLYQMLAGDVPFDTTTPYRLLKDIVESDIANIQEVNPKVDDKTAAILLKMIDKNPENRYQSCQEILDELGKVEKNSDLESILHRSRINPIAEKTSKISYQLTQISQPTQIGKRKKKISLAIIAVAIITISALAYNYTRNSSSEKKVDPLTEFIAENNIGEKDKNASKTQIDEQTNDQNNDLSAKTDDENSIITGKCLEIAHLSVLEQDSDKIRKKDNEAPDTLLEDIRQYLVKQLGKDKSINSHFAKIQNECVNYSQPYRLSLLISDYKKSSKFKVISKMTWGKDRITVILTLRDLTTNQPIANKEIETRDISGQINSKDSNSEFLQSVLEFIQDSI